MMGKTIMSKKTSKNSDLDQFPRKQIEQTKNQNNEKQISFTDKESEAQHDWVKQKAKTQRKQQCIIEKQNKEQEKFSKLENQQYQKWM